MPLNEAQNAISNSDWPTFKVGHAPSVFTSIYEHNINGSASISKRSICMRNNGLNSIHHTHPVLC